MTTALTASTTNATDRLRVAGIVCLVAGLLGAASGVFLAVVEPSVDDGRFSYPLTARGFVAIQIWFVIQHLGLLAGQVAVWTSGAAGRGRLARAGHLLATGGMVVLALMEAVATAAADSAYPSPRTDLLDIGYGISSTAIGVGLVLLGVAVVRTHAWTDRGRWLPLFVGVWTFVVVFPAMMSGFLGARLGISSWMLCYAALGWYLSRRRAH